MLARSEKHLLMIAVPMLVICCLGNEAQGDLVQWTDPGSSNTTGPINGSLVSGAFATNLTVTTEAIGGIDQPLVRQDTGGGNFIFVEESGTPLGRFVFSFDDRVAADLVLDFSSLDANTEKTQIGNFTLDFANGQTVSAVFGVDYSLDAGTNLEELIASPGIFRSSSTAQGHGSFTFENVTASNPIEGFSFDFVNASAGNGGGVVLQVSATAVPEPTLTIVLAIMGARLLLRRSRPC